ENRRTKPTQPLRAPQAGSRHRWRLATRCPAAGGQGGEPPASPHRSTHVQPPSGRGRPRRWLPNPAQPIRPNYCRPPAPAAPDWIDAADPRVRKDHDDLSRWWAVFKDPVLESLIRQAYGQNLTLRQAGTRVLQARAQQAIAVGNVFPQTQQATGDLRRYARSTKVPNNQNVRAPFYSEWVYGFTFAWELDFWGRFRRAVESANASLDASVEDYDYVIVTLLGDVATYYAQMRILEQQIA